MTPSWLLAGAIALFGLRAHAEEDDVVARARDAYDSGSAAYLRGDYARAASEFARADTLVPNAVTLRAAVDAATLADDAVLGTELLRRADRVVVDAELAKAIERARARFQHRTGLIVLHCLAVAVGNPDEGREAPERSSCLGTVDGAPLSPLSPRVVGVGVHTVTLDEAGHAEQRLVEVSADQTVDVRVTPEALRTPEAPHHGVSPVWFWGSLAATGALLGLSVWSGADTLSQHGSFESANCMHMTTPSCVGLSSQGESAQRRTNLLLLATGLAGAGTAAIGLFAVRWGERGEATSRLALDPSRVTLTTTFP